MASLNAYFAHRELEKLPSKRKSSKKSPRCSQYPVALAVAIDHFTVVCSVTWPLDGSEAGVDLVLISLLLLCKTSCSNANQVHLHYKSSEVCIKTRSTPASQQSKGQVPEQTTVKCSISA